MEMKPLNIFQRVIRTWEEAHPYNAAQILEIAGEAERERLARTWNETLAASGLGVACVKGRYFGYEPAPPQEVVSIDPVKGLAAFLTAELNRPFSTVRRGEDTAAVPFRAFMCEGEGSYHLGLIYQHWVADSIAIRMLLRGWFYRVQGLADAAGGPLHLPTGGFWRYFGPERGKWNLVEGTASVLEGMADFATARRIEEESGPQEVECSLHRLPDRMVDDLRAVAHRRKARGQPTTVNDLLLAALARACDWHGAEPRRCGRDLALGTIVDLRASSRENLDNTFGIFLGFTSLVVPGPVLDDRERVLDKVVARNQQMKEARAAQVSMLRMAVGYAQGRLLSPRQLASFYRNYMPFSGGLSNVTMHRSWPSQHHPLPLLDYIRVAPTGPMVPLVIAVTTLGNRFTFTLTRRASLVDRVRGEQLATMFIAELTAFAKTG